MMRIARSALTLALLAGSLEIAPPIYSLDQRTAKERKKSEAAKPAPPPPNNTDAQARIDRKESRMTRRDKEIDQRMKTQKH